LRGWLLAARVEPFDSPPDRLFLADTSRERPIERSGEQVRQWCGAIGCQDPRKHDRRGNEERYWGDEIEQECEFHVSSPGSCDLVDRSQACPLECAPSQAPIEGGLCSPSKRESEGVREIARLLGYTRRP
jgi:hypothetical protein